MALVIFSFCRVLLYNEAEKRGTVYMYTILLIEDDEAICKELQLLLEKQGYEAVCWNLQSDICDVIRQCDPHIILLDINLPQMDGFTLCSRFAAFPRCL